MSLTDLLREQLVIFAGEIDGIENEIKALYAKKDVEKDEAKAEELLERIRELEADKADLNDQRKGLLAKLDAGGVLKSS